MRGARLEGVSSVKVTVSFEHGIIHHLLRFSGGSGGDGMRRSHRCGERSERKRSQLQEIWVRSVNSVFRRIRSAILTEPNRTRSIRHRFVREWKKRRRWRWWRWSLSEWKWVLDRYFLIIYSFLNIGYSLVCKLILFF